MNKTADPLFNILNYDDLNYLLLNIPVELHLKFACLSRDLRQLIFNCMSFTTLRQFRLLINKSERPARLEDTEFESENIKQIFEAENRQRLIGSFRLQWNRRFPWLGLMSELQVLVVSSADFCLTDKIFWITAFDCLSQQLEHLEIHSSQLSRPFNLQLSSDRQWPKLRYLHCNEIHDFRLLNAGLPALTHLSSLGICLLDVMNFTSE